MSTTPCLKCGTPLTIPEPGRHRFVACGACLSCTELAGGQAHIRHTFAGLYKNKHPRIAVGAPVHWQGVAYTVAGWLYKQEKGSDFRWDEFVLWHPDHPNAVLVVLQDEAIVVTPATSKPVVQEMGVNVFVAQYENIVHELENTYQFNLLKAEGAFDWDVVHDAGRMVCQEYENESSFLIHEVLEGQSDWYAGHYLSRLELREAIPDGFKFNSGYGFSAVQQDTIATRRKALLYFALAASALVLLVYGLGAVFQPERTLLNEPFVTEHDAQGSVEAGRPIRTGSFAVDGPTGVTLEFTASLDNSWSEFSGTLVDEATGKEREFSTTAESYHGYDSDGSWSEGDASPEIKIGALPTGRYHLNIEPATDYGKSVAGFITVRHHTLWDSNLILMLLVIWAYPLLYREFTKEE